MGSRDTTCWRPSASMRRTVWVSAQRSLNGATAILPGSAWSPMRHPSRPPAPISARGWCWPRATSTTCAPRWRGRSALARTTGCDWRPPFRGGRATRRNGVSGHARVLDAIPRERGEKRARPRALPCGNARAGAGRLSRRRRHSTTSASRYFVRSSSPRALPTAWAVRQRSQSGAGTSQRQKCAPRRQLRTPGRSVTHPCLALGLVIVAAALRAGGPRRRQWPLLAEAEQVARQTGDGIFLAYTVLNNLGAHATEDRRYELATAYFRESIEILHGMYHQDGIAEALEGFASIATWQCGVRREPRACWPLRRHFSVRPDSCAAA